jgi:hypothetical protein
MDFKIKDLWPVVWPNPRLVPDKCLKDQNFLFIQYTCVHSADTMHHRYNAICFIAFMSVLMALIFMIWTHTSLKNSELNKRMYDLKTCTAADYTIKMIIDQEVY